MTRRLRIVIVGPGRAGQALAKVRQAGGNQVQLANAGGG